MNCIHCGTSLEEDEKFCHQCGKNVKADPIVSSPTKHKKRSWLHGYRVQDLTLTEAEKGTKQAAIAALVVAGLSVLFILLGVLDAWTWADVGLVLLFSLGVYRKNRIAAVGLFIYFIISKFVQIGEAKNLTIWSFLVALSFLYYFYFGMLGAIRYQQLVPKEKRRGGIIFGLILGSLATLFTGFLLLGLLPNEEEATPQDIILQADYQEGYKAGYVDGRASQADIGDSYVEIATEERRGAYDVGYLKGFVDGCHEGGFDCSEIEQTVNKLLDNTKIPDGLDVQLIPNSI